MRTSADQRSSSRGRAPGRTRIESAAFSLPRAGSGPDANEDSYRVAGGEETISWADFVAVVADGVGSSSDPATASETATETWLQFLERRFTERPEGLPSFDKTQFGQLLRECFEQSHRQVQRNAPGGSATAAGICVQGDWLLAASVGDARIYHAGARGFGQVTHDQIDPSGNPTEVLGGRVAAPSINSFAKQGLQEGDWLVIGSDGLTKTLAPNELDQLLQRVETPRQAAQLILQRARDQAIPDDVTAVIARVLQIGQPIWLAGGASDESLASHSLKTASPSHSLDESSRNPVEASSTRKPESASRATTKTGSPAANPTTTHYEKTEDDLLEELSERVARLERSLSGGGLPQQERARLEREFGRLEQEIQRVESLVPRSSLTGPLVTGYLIGALVLGLTLGAFFIPNLAVRGSRNGSVSSGQPSKVISLQPPPGFQVSLGHDATERGIVLRYRTTEGGTRVAIYSYNGEGTPERIYEVPVNVSPRDDSETPDLAAPDGRRSRPESP